jgi:hypothetical protein
MWNLNPRFQAVITGIDAEKGFITVDVRPDSLAAVRKTLNALGGFAFS